MYNWGPVELFPEYRFLSAIRPWKPWEPFRWRRMLSKNPGYLLSFLR